MIWICRKKNKLEGILLKDPELTPSKDIRDCQNEESPMSYWILGMVEAPLRSGCKKLTQLSGKTPLQKGVRSSSWHASKQYSRQYHQIIQVGMHPWRSSSLTVCSKQVPLHQVAQHFGKVLNCYNNEDYTALSGCLFWCLTTFTMRKNKHTHTTPHKQQNPQNPKPKTTPTNNSTHVLRISCASICICCLSSHCVSSRRIWFCYRYNHPRSIVIVDSTKNRSTVPFP